MLSQYKAALGGRWRDTKVFYAIALDGHVVLPVNSSGDTVLAPGGMEDRSTLGRNNEQKSRDYRASQVVARDVAVCRI